MRLFPHEHVAENYTPPSFAHWTKRDIEDLRLSAKKYLESRKEADQYISQSQEIGEFILVMFALHVV